MTDPLTNVTHSWVVSAGLDRAPESIEATIDNYVRPARYAPRPLRLAPRSSCRSPAALDLAAVLPLVHTSIHTARLLRLQVHSLYWAFTTLTVVGYGDRGGVPQNEYEMAFVLLMELLGVCVTGQLCSSYRRSGTRLSSTHHPAPPATGYVIGTISQLMANFSIRDTLYQEKMELVNRCAHLPHATHERLPAGRIATSEAPLTSCHARATAL